jgi:hypothetical protein
MPHRQTVEFLRRRYAVAILRDDADTAGRLRAQLDGMMNPPAGAAQRSKVRQPEACLREVPTGPEPSVARAAGSGPQLCLLPSVTGLLEGPRRGQRDR